jgi:hypothetical protein
MIYQAVVIVFLVGTPSPIQFEYRETSTTVSECFMQASVMLTNFIRSANRPVLSGQSFCLDVNSSKKKAVPLGNKKKESSGGSDI